MVVVFSAVVVLGNYAQGAERYFARPAWSAQPHHSSTAAEGYLRGRADLRRSTGRYLEGLGRYQNDHQDARTKAIDNWDHSVRTKWALQDSNRERRFGYSYLDRYENKLNQAERRFQLRQREKDLIAKGVLPPKPTGQWIVIRGKKYNTVAEWRGTRDYVLHQSELAERRLIREIEKLRAERRHKQAIAFSVWWERKGYAGKQRYQAQRSLAAKFPGHPSPRPKFQFPDIERNIEVHFRVLKKVRDQQEQFRSK